MGGSGGVYIHHALPAMVGSAHRPDRTQTGLFKYKYAFTGPADDG